MKDLHKKLKTDIPVFTYDITDSTNTRAREYLQNHSDCENALFIANGQSAGRGRQGKSFYSPSGTGVYFSYVCRAETDLVCITAKAAVAVILVLENLCAVELKIKWVNDIYLKNKKICGILCERTGGHIIIGIGINLTTDKFPPDIADKAASLNICCDKTDIIAGIVNLLSDIRDMDWYNTYKAKSLVLGKNITYIQNGVSYNATAEDIGSSGELLVRSKDGTRTALTSGEISLFLGDFL